MSWLARRPSYRCLLRFQRALAGLLPVPVSLALGSGYETLLVCATLALLHSPRDRNSKWVAVFDPTRALRVTTLAATASAWLADTYKVDVAADADAVATVVVALALTMGAFYAGADPATLPPTDALLAISLFPTSLILRLALRPHVLQSPCADCLSALAHALLFAFVLRHSAFSSFANRRRVHRWVPDDDAADRRGGANGAPKPARHLLDWSDLLDQLTRSLPAGGATLPTALVQIVAAFAHEPLLVDLADDWSHLFCGAPDDCRSKSATATDADAVAGDRLQPRRPAYTLRDFERRASSRRQDNAARDDPVIQLAPRQRFVLRIQYSALAQVGGGNESCRYMYLVDLRTMCDPDARPLEWARLVQNLERYSSMERLLRDDTRATYDIRDPAHVHLGPVRVADGVVAPRTWSDVFGPDRRGASSFDGHAREYGTFAFQHGHWPPFGGARLLPHTGTMFVALGDLEMDPTADYFYVGFHMTSPDADLRARLHAHGS